MSRPMHDIIAFINRLIYRCISLCIDLLMMILPSLPAVAYGSLLASRVRTDAMTAVAVRYPSSIASDWGRCTDDGA